MLHECLHRPNGNNLFDVQPRNRLEEEYQELCEKKPVFGFIDYPSTTLWCS